MNIYIYIYISMQKSWVTQPKVDNYKIGETCTE